ncbi:MAG: hypothetical protein ACOC7U_02635 [Spirochaetota bacterium]
MNELNLSTDKKVLLGAVGFAFLVSLIIGLTVQNQAGIAVMRAFICSALFGAITYGGIYVIRQYIPEVEQLASENEQEQEQEHRHNEDKETGRLVDYLVQDENQQAGEGASGAGDYTPAGGLEPGEWEEQQQASGSSQQGQKNFSFDAHTSPEGGTSGVQKKGKEKTGDQQKQKDIYEQIPSMDYLFEEELDEQGSEPEETKEEQQEHSAPEAKKSYISVGKSRIPNDPQAIARAIQRVMKENE